MSSGGSEGTGGGAFFVLASVILAGLLFAAGVMVGRNLAQAPCPPAPDPLSRADSESVDAGPGSGRKWSAPGILLDPAPRPLPVPAPRPAPEDGGTADAGGNGATPDPRSEAAPPRRFAVQVAAFKEAGPAQALVERLASRGYPEVRVSEAAPGKGATYRVRAGNFSRREEAEELARRLEGEEKFKVLVVIEE